MDETAQQPIVYQLDKKRRIIDVDGPWDRFALENDGAAACAERVIGQPLLHFVSGDDARMWIDTLLQLAALTSQPLERPYRCDSPELRRFMKMRVLPEDGGMLRVEHLLLEVQPRVRPVRFLPVPGNYPKLRLRCSICGRVKCQDRWQEAEHCCEEGAGTPTIAVAYTVCPTCGEERLSVPAGWSGKESRPSSRLP